MLLINALTHVLRRLGIELAKYILDCIGGCNNLHVSQHTHIIAQSYQIFEIPLINFHTEYTISVEQTGYFPTYFSTRAFNQCSTLRARFEQMYQQILQNMEIVHVLWYGAFDELIYEKSQHWIVCFS